MYKVLVMSELKKTVGIIGLGLIGGSMAIDLKKRGFAGKVLGVEADKVAAQAAMTMGLADEMVSLEDCVDRSDIIVVAVPVGAAVKMLPEILDRIKEIEDCHRRMFHQGAHLRRGEVPPGKEAVCVHSSHGGYGVQRPVGSPAGPF